MFVIVAVASVRATYLDTLQGTRDRFAALDPVPDEGDFEASQITVKGCVYERESEVRDNACIFQSEDPQCPTKILVDYSEREIPPTEGFIRQVAALDFFRNKAIVPSLVVDETVDPRLILTGFIGMGTIMNVRFKQSVARIAEIGVGLLEILKRVHAAGVVHGNLTPANIVYSWEQMVESMRVTGWHSSRCLMESDFAMHEPELKLKKRSIFADPRPKTPRDDVAAVAEILINLLCGNEDLFTSQYVAKNMDPDTLRALRLKRADQLRLAFTSLPAGFLQFHDYAVRLQYTDVPDYDGWLEVLNLIARDPANQLPLGERSPIDLRNLNMARAKRFEILYLLGNDGQMAGRQVLLRSETDIGVSIADEFYGTLVPLSVYLDENPETATCSRDLARLCRELLLLVRSIHELGIVHNGISLRSFFYAQDLKDGKWIWKIDGFERARVFVNADTGSHRQPSKIALRSDVTDLSSESLFLLRDQSLPSRRDDVLALAELILDIVEGRKSNPISDRAVALSWKSNRYLRFTSGQFATFARLYRHATLLGFFDRPDYESALEELSLIYRA